MAVKRKVGNLLALSVLAYLTQRPMHPYELGRTLCDHGDARSIKFASARSTWWCGHIVIGCEHLPTWHTDRMVVIGDAAHAPGRAPRCPSRAPFCGASACGTCRTRSRHSQPSSKLAARVSRASSSRPPGSTTARPPRAWAAYSAT
jgi:hypothetical protein